MLRNNRGSILVTTLVFFTIIITVCMSCIALTYSNNSYSKLQYKHTKIEELALSGIEITKSSILYHVKYAIDKFDKKEDFANYFLGNERIIIGNTSELGVNNVRVTVKEKISEDSDGNMGFVIESICKEGEHTKRIKANVKIINPWTNDQEDLEIVEIESADFEVKESINNKDNENDAELNQDNEYTNENIDNIKNHKSNFDEKKLVIIYNYEEN